MFTKNCFNSLLLFRWLIHLILVRYFKKGAFLWPVSVDTETRSQRRLVVAHCTNYVFYGVLRFYSRKVYRHIASVNSVKYLFISLQLWLQYQNEVKGNKQHCITDCVDTFLSIPTSDLTWNRWVLFFLCYDYMAQYSTGVRSAMR